MGENFDCVKTMPENWSQPVLPFGTEMACSVERSERKLVKWNMP